MRAVVALTGPGQERAEVRALLLRAGATAGADSVTFLSAAGQVCPLNTGAVLRALEAVYRRAAAERAAVERSVAALRVDEGGRVTRAWMAESSGNPKMDSGVLQALRMMRFDVLRVRGCASPFWTTMPVSFHPRAAGG